jgi:hypothetical protein
MLFRKKKSGQSTLEYAVFIIILLGAMFVIQKYIARAFSGRWKGVGDSWGQGRQYSPTKTTRCAHAWPRGNFWYDEVCFRTTLPVGDCTSAVATAASCLGKMTACQTPRCD